GHAVEEQQLVEPEPQRSGDGGVELVDRTRERGDVVVERAEPLDRAERELAREGTVAAHEIARLRVQRAVGVGALLGHAPQDGEGGETSGSDGLAGGQHDRPEARATATGSALMPGHRLRRCRRRRRSMADSGGVPPVARVEPITTARALRGPFDYLRPEGVDVGSMLVVPFGHRDVLGVVVGIAEESEVADDRLVAPREVLDAELPVDLVELAGWIAVEYCSTPARGLSLVSPH